MKERPITFDGQGVRAILEGRKTQTRRLIRPRPIESEDGVRFPWATFFKSGHVHTWDRNGVGGQNWNISDFPNENMYSVALARTPYENPCPYGIPGDRLWVRETCYVESLGYPDGKGKFVLYKATDRDCPVSRWTPSIHMLRLASRITLEVVGVRVERVQDVSNHDAIAEGAHAMLSSGAPYPNSAAKWSMERPHPVERDQVNGDRHCLGSARMAFANLWNSINQKRGFGWDMNPWVWVIEFRRIK